ncbi:hypothetical protein JYB64_10520 [Algoriphagus aestuarii]|nr:hypothetical protein [Algoriphagus aestuarii]
MGSWSELKIGSYSGFYAKNRFYEVIVELLFDYEDFQQREVLRDDETFMESVFETSVQVCLDRLIIIGSSENNARKEFDTLLKMEEDSSIPETYDRYVEFILKCIRSGLNKNELESELLFPDSNAVANDFRIGLSTHSWLFSILYCLEPELKITYDLSEVINAGWVYPEELKFLDYEKIIVLTEGKTDTNFIKTSIEMLYPHLVGRYHFMNFEDLDLNGSASFLVHNVKSFIGSGIKNKIVALFDNDTAGRKEHNRLMKFEIPHNIKVLKYPEINLAENYPTLGPTGVQEMNVNGLACSIEMYLGADVLRDANNELSPIQWKGYDQAMNSYQGELIDKGEIQKRFREKVKHQKANGITSSGWDEMEILLRNIMNAWIKFELFLR